MIKRMISKIAIYLLSQIDFDFHMFNGDLKIDVTFGEVKIWDKLIELEEFNKL